MAKSPDAFRTISEVADWLGIQAHVLRFWESKFSQVKPIKRAGGRRYYRPADMLLLGGIKKLLHEDGLTIKGVQKILREQGMGHVADLSQPLDDTTLSQLDDMPAEIPQMPEPAAEEQDQNVVLSFEPPAPPEPEPEAPAAVDAVMQQTPAAATEDVPETVDPEPAPAEADADTPEPYEEEEIAAQAAQEPVPAADPPERDAPQAPPSAQGDVHTAPPPPVSQAPAQTGEPAAPAPRFVHRAAGGEPDATPEKPAAAQPAPSATLPAFLRRPLVVDETPQDKTPEDAEREPAEPPAMQVPESQAPSVPEDVTPPAAPPKPRIVDVGPLPPEPDQSIAPGTLTACYRTRVIGPTRAGQIVPLLARLNTLRDAMNARRRNAGSGPAAG